MKIIALDSSGLVASVAILCDNDLVGEYTINHKKTHSQTLLPMLDELKQMTELELESVDAIAVAGGPGSFTGLRIGSSTAKGLAWTLHVPVISVPTLEAMAYHFYGSDQLICPIMDARRSQVYCGVYTFIKNANQQAQQGGGSYQLCVVKSSCAIGIEDLIEELNGLGKEVIFLGDGVPVYQDRIAERMTTSYVLAPAHCNRQRAANVAALGAVYYVEGKYQQPAEHAPEYFRLSQAERERLEAEKGEQTTC